MAIPLLDYSLNSRLTQLPVFMLDLKLKVEWLLAYLPMSNEFTNEVLSRICLFSLFKCSY